MNGMKELKLLILVLANSNIRALEEIKAHQVAHNIPISGKIVDEIDKLWKLKEWLEND